MNNASIKRFFEEGAVWFAEGASTASIFDPCSVENNCKTDSEHLPLASFDVPEIDHELQNNGLQFGCLHEWFSYSPTLLAILAGNAIKDSIKNTGVFSGFILWIGRESWPTPFLLQQTLKAGHSFLKQSFLKQCLFLDIKDAKDRYWCFETSLRSPAVAVSICCLKGLNFVRTRRLALAAKRGSSLGFLVRPERELRFSSAAATRWQITSVPSPASEPRWQLSLLKQKGKQPNKSSWIIEFYQDEKISVHISAALADQSGAQETDKMRRFA